MFGREASRTSRRPEELSLCDSGLREGPRPALEDALLGAEGSALTRQAKAMAHVPQPSWEKR